MKRGSSTRLMGAPSTSVIVVTPLSRRHGGSGPLAHHDRGRLDRGDDVVVAGAAADVALDRMTDLLLGRIGVPRQEIGRGPDHAGRTDPALEAVFLPERVL